MTANLRPGHQLNKPSKKENSSFLRAVPSNNQISHMPFLVQEGQLQVHTTPYRGSFSMVLSEALRAAGLGSEVLVAQFLKGGVDQGPNNMTELCGKLKWLRPDVNCCITEKAQQNALNTQLDQHQKAVQEIWDVCKNHLISGDINQLVLDEVGLAITLGYLKEDDVVSTLEKRPRTMDVILIGSSIPNRVISMADQVTELRCVH